MNAFHENKLIGDIYDAALNPSLWRNILVAIRDAMMIDECTIFFYDAQCRARNYAECASGDDEVKELFLRDWIDVEVAVLDQHFKSVPVGLVIQAPTFEEIGNQKYEKFLGEDYCDDLLKTLEVRGGTMLIHGKIIAAAMGFKSFNTSPQVTEEAIKFSQRLAPHIMQAMRIHNHITSLQTTYNSLYSVLNAVGYGVFLLGKLGEVLFSNNEAARMIEAQCGLCFAKGGALQHTNSQANSLLQQAILSLLDGSTPTDPHALNLALAHAQTNFPLQVNILPIHHEHAQHFSTSGASLALFIKDPNKPLTIPKSYLQQAYQLTDTEIVVAQLLLDALDTTTIAQKRNTSLETTRGHIKQLLQKTNTHSQAELVGLLTCLSSEL